MSAASGSGRKHALTDAMVESYVQNRISVQFSVMMPTLFPGALADNDVPYHLVDNMWVAFENAENSKTSAINRHIYLSAVCRSFPDRVPGSSPSLGWGDGTTSGSYSRDS